MNYFVPGRPLDGKRYRVGHPDLRVHGWRNQAFVPLRSVRRPWSTHVSWHPGLYDRTKEFTEVFGVFRMTLRLDPALRDEPEAVQRFVIAHEVQHMVGRHGFWAALSWLGGPLTFFLVRRIQEQIADRVAAERCRKNDALIAVALLHRSPKRWWPRLVHAWLYGSPMSRLERCGVRLAARSF